jgi:epoxyqueuosine reductase
MNRGVSASLSARIRNEAERMGFDLVGFARAQASPHGDAYRAWLAAGHQGDMAWLGRDPERRIDPARVLPGARSVVVVGLSYYMEDPPADLWNDPSRGRIARYAWGRDYHDVLLPMLEELARFIASEHGEPFSSRAYVDTGPVLERDLAARARLGFVGKNTLLIHPRLGSYLFLGEILLDVDLDFDEAVDDPPEGPTGRGTCGSCRRCQDICPTHAFPAPYILNSRLCISYLTIELKAAIPEALRPLMGHWIYGCDECQSVCPWVRQFAQPGRTRFLRAEPESMAPRLLDLIALDDAGFRDRFRGTPILRTKRRGLLRNVAVALGNWGDPAARSALEKAARDPEALIREHAAWALTRLHPS